MIWGHSDYMTYNIDKSDEGAVFDSAVDNNGSETGRGTGLHPGTHFGMFTDIDGRAAGQPELFVVGIL